MCQHTRITAFGLHTWAGKGRLRLPLTPPQSMPRPPSRTITRSLRFTAQEWDDVEKKLGGRDFSAVARALLLGAEIPEPKAGRKPAVKIERRRMTEAEAERNRQLNWIGNNLNQLAKLANTRRDAVSVLSALVSLEREVRRIGG